MKIRDFGASGGPKHKILEKPIYIRDIDRHMGSESTECAEIMEIQWNFWKTTKSHENIVEDILKIPLKYLHSGHDLLH